jgi:hypothetical protein
MTAEFYGHPPMDQKAVYDRLKKPVPGQRNEWCVTGDDVVQEARRMGYEAGWKRVNFGDPAAMLADIRWHLDRGEPLMALQRTAMQSPNGHSRLIVGIEDAASKEEDAHVFVHDPSATSRSGVPPGGANRKWKAPTFAQFWKPSGQMVTGGVAIWLTKPAR